MPTPTVSAIEGVSQPATKVAAPPKGKAMRSPLEKMVRWILLLEQTAHEAAGSAQLRGIICREHFDCIKAVCGPQTEHMQWKTTNAATIAQELIGRASPPAD